MRTRRFLAGLFVCSALITGAALAQDYDAQQRKAAAMLDALDAGRYDEARADFDEPMREALTVERLRQIWEALPEQVGAAIEHGPAHPEQINDLSAVVTPLHYRLATLDALITFDADDRINGFRLVPGKPMKTKPEAAPEGAPFSETEVAVGPSERSLPGTLTLPHAAAPFPAVVLVAGSGPNDRDSTIGPNKPLRDLAHGLAAQGIAVLRFDKRSHARPQDFATGDVSIDTEVTDDVLAALALLRQRPEIDPNRLFVLGHSLGAMLAPRVGQRDPDLAGLLLLAPPARALEDAIVEQTAYLASADGDISNEEQKILNRLQRQRDNVRALRDGATGFARDDLPLNVPASYWRSLQDYDPVAVAATLSLPMLVLRGGRDYQVTAGEFERWRAIAVGGDQRVTLKQYPRLNHLFIDGDGPSLPAEYGNPGHVDPLVIADVGSWIAAH